VNDLQRTIFTVLVACAVSVPAQTIHVSIAPADRTNNFVPTQTLGAGVDRIPREAFEKDLVPETVAATLDSGWQTVTYRQNTELAIQAWHWNPKGTWSDPNGKGYFTGSTELGDPIRHSYGYVLPHRGVTRNDGTGNTGYSRLTDGDPETYWKSNPYLTQRFTGEDDSLHPQWVIMDLGANQLVDTMRIDWAEPFATHYIIQYWTTDADPVHMPTRGVWQTFANAEIIDGKGGPATIHLASSPMSVRYVRILMTASSNSCDTHGSSDPRNCVGYAIRELALGTTSVDGQFHDLVRHTPDQEQTATICSSIDPWHEPDGLESTFESQIGFDFFYTSGITRGLPAMIPVAMLYDTPENAVAEISYIEKRHYPISYVEMGEEADGQFMLPEDYAALYLQWATALHRVDPSLKLGGPAFTGENKDIEVWPDDQGRTSWTGRFLDYLRKHQRMSDLAFFSFEHYPYEPCKISWSSLYEEPTLMSHIMQVWRDDGLPANVPMFVTESNLSSATSETYMDIFSGIWLADYIGTFLTSGGKGVYYFHYLPLQLERGCNDSAGTFGMFTVDPDYKIKQRLAQFFASQMITQQWVEPGNGEHHVYPATSVVDDGAGHSLVTTYALERPDGEWSLMIVNRDQFNPHTVHIDFDDGASHAESHFTGTVHIARFGRDQYQWRPRTKDFTAHRPEKVDTPAVIYAPGNADPDGPIAESAEQANADRQFDLPAASITVIHGRIARH
jgi:hypothetical protein